MQNPQLSWQYFSLFLAIIMFVMAVYATCTGKLRGRFGDVADRAKDPKRYGTWLTIYYLAGIGFIGCFLYEVGGFSN
jgi:hypothetical protein